MKSNAPCNGITVAHEGVKGWQRDVSPSITCHPLRYTVTVSPRTSKITVTHRPRYGYSGLPSTSKYPRKYLRLFAPVSDAISASLVPFQCRPVMMT